MLKFSEANAKIRALATVAGIKPYLQNKRKVFSFDLLSGHNCPYAKDCLSKAVEQPNGSRKIEDGKHTEFRCFSASQEVLFTNLYNLRKNNTEILSVAARDGYSVAASHLLAAMPRNAGVIRIHVGGDFNTSVYFQAWLEVAKRRPDLLIYAYTKSLPFVVKHIKAVNELPNFVLTASYGGKRDELIVKHGLRYAKVVKSEAEALELGLPIDHDDSHAADPTMKGVSFALLVHGPQKAGSDWGVAMRKLRGLGSYSR
jgi:hypothetical protein